MDCVTIADFFPHIFLIDFYTLRLKIATTKNKTTNKMNVNHAIDTAVGMTKKAHELKFSCKI